VLKWVKNWRKPRTSPRIEDLLAKGRDYVSRNEEIYPAPLGLSIGESDGTSFTLLHLLATREGIVEQRYGVLCRETSARLASFETLHLDDNMSLFCPVCDRWHEEMRDELVVDIFFRRVSSVEKAVA
jgi:hypothetical protein